MAESPAVPALARRRLALALAGLLAVLCLAGCGHGGDSSGAETNTPSKREEGGEKGIEDFGSEASGDSRTELLSVFRRYLGAIARESYDDACADLAASVQQSVGRLVDEHGNSNACATALPKLLSPTAATIARRQGNGKITKVRVEGDRGFIVYHAPGARLYQLTMVREGGDWKSAAVIGSILVPSPATFGD